LYLFSDALFGVPVQRDLDGRAIPSIDGDIGIGLCEIDL
jgi:hypothetical protein